MTRYSFLESRSLLLSSSLLPPPIDKFNPCRRETRSAFGDRSLIVACVAFDDEGDTAKGSKKGPCREAAAAGATKEIRWICIDTSVRQFKICCDNVRLNASQANSGR
jgi:hypothetical protein